MVKIKEELSAYERERLENVARNQALLRELQLKTVADSFSTPKRPIAKASSKSTGASKRKAVVKREPNTEPRRTSSRLLGLTADSEVAKRKAEDEMAAMVEANAAKRRRRAGALDLNEIVNDTKVKSEWKGLGGLDTKYERTFTEKDVKETSDKSLRELRQRMNGLELYEGFGVAGEYSLFGLELCYDEIANYRFLKTLK
jgi:WD repeat-containing protein 76